MLAVELERSWAIAQTPPYHVYLKSLYELYHTDVHTPELVPATHGGRWPTFSWTLCAAAWR